MMQDVETDDAVTSNGEQADEEEHHELKMTSVKEDEETDDEVETAYEDNGSEESQ